MKQENEEITPIMEENPTEELFLEAEQVEQPIENIFSNSNSPFLYATNEETTNLVEPTVGVSPFVESVSNPIVEGTIQENVVGNEGSILDEVEIPTTSFTEIKVEPENVEEYKNESSSNEKVDEKKVKASDGESAKGNLVFIFVFGILLLAITFLLPYISGYK